MSSLRYSMRTLGRRLRKLPRRGRARMAVTRPFSVDEEQVKCIVVGDNGVGKSSLLVRYTADYFVFNSQDMPSGPVFDSNTGHPVPVQVAEQQYNLLLFDTFSQRERETTRVASYPGTDVCIICFSVINPSTFHNVETVWLPEVRRNLPRVPIILVGTQMDLRDDLTVVQGLHKSREMPISSEEAERMAKRIKAKCYLECSALTMKGIDQVFERALLRALRKRKKDSTSAVKKISNFFERLTKGGASRSSKHRGELLQDVR